MTTMFDQLINKILPPIESNEEAVAKALARPIATGGMAIPVSSTTPPAGAAGWVKQPNGTFVKVAKPRPLTPQIPNPQAGPPENELIPAELQGQFTPTGGMVPSKN